MHSALSRGRGSAFASSFVVLVAGVSVGGTLVGTAYAFSLFGLAIAGAVVLLATCGLALWLTGRENRARFASLVTSHYASRRTQALRDFQADQAAAAPAPRGDPLPAAPQRPSLGAVRAAQRAAEAAAKSREAPVARLPSGGTWPPGGRPYPESFREARPAALVEFQRVPPALAAVSATDGASLGEPPAGPPRDPLAWPGKNDADAWRTFQGEAPRRYEARDLAPEGARRKGDLARRLPTVGGMLQEAPRADPRGTPPGKTKGRCSGCGTHLFAPEKRPITLVCPRCGNKARLT